jgi:hypothetical protein
MLYIYRQQVQRLLSDTVQTRFNPADLDFYINLARGQIAGEGECIRQYASLALNSGQQQYPFSDIMFPGGSAGIAGVFNVRMANYFVASGQKRITAREWEWFNEHVMNNAVPVPSAPQYWAQFGQGANGTLFFNLPDTTYTLALDTVCVPTPLETDADPEPVPYLWTDAVPYFAAYTALLTAQQQDAALGMFKLYETFVQRARAAATPSVLPGQYPQQPDPFMAGRLGVTPRGAA